jgi:O-antigen/teichoic acid export membrane protein
MLHGAIFDHHANGIATALRRRDSGPIRRILRSIRLESTVATIVIAIVAAASMALWWQYLPPTYREAAWPLAILLAARLLSGAVGPMPALLTLGGGQRALTRVTVVAALIVCLGASASGAWFGVSGLALASACGLSTYSVLALRAVRRMPSTGKGTSRPATTSISAQ